MGLLGRNLTKALRELSPIKESLIEKIYLSDYLDWFFKIKSWVISKKEMIQRMIFWGWNMRWSWDFDAGTIYQMLYLKLDRTYNCMRDNSHLVWNSDTETTGMRKLCEAKLLAKKLAQDDYHKEYERLSNMYKGPKDKESILDVFRDEHYPHAKEINQKLFSFMLRKSFQRDNLEKKTDKQRLFKLLETHIDSWWD